MWRHTTPEYSRRLEVWSSCDATLSKGCLKRLPKFGIAEVEEGLQVALVSLLKPTGQVDGVQDLDSFEQHRTMHGKDVVCPFLGCGGPETHTAPRALMDDRYVETDEAPHFGDVTNHAEIHVRRASSSPSATAFSFDMLAYRARRISTSRRVSATCR